MRRSNRMTYRFLDGIFVAICALLGPAAPAAAKGVDTKVLEDLKFRYIGPEGNRVSAIAGVTGDPNVYYAGAASGGIFKTVDGGVHWKPVFDGQPVASIGALAVSPS